MWEYFCRERDRVKRFREQAEEKNRQEYKVSGSRNRQPTSTWSKLKAAMTLTAQKMMKKEFTALKSGDWEEYRSIFQG